MQGLWGATPGVNLKDPDFIKLGAPPDYTEISKTDGTVRYRGNATMWKDMIADLFGRRLNSTAGKVDYNYTDNVLNFQSGGSISNIVDRVGGSLEINHEFLVGSGITIKPHIHWFQEVISHSPDVLDTTAYELTSKWRLVRNGRGITLTDAWTEIVLTSNLTNNIFDATYADGKDYMGQISRFPDIVVDCGISDTIQFQMARTDALGGTMMVYFLDMHGQVDGAGSEDEIAKED